MDCQMLSCNLFTIRAAPSSVESIEYASSDQILQFKAFTLVVWGNSRFALLRFYLTFFYHDSAQSVWWGKPTGQTKQWAGKKPKKHQTLELLKQPQCTLAASKYSHLRIDQEVCRFQVSGLDIQWDLDRPAVLSSPVQWSTHIYIEVLS